jgi:hypothetical protein
MKTLMISLAALAAIATTSLASEDSSRGGSDYDPGAYIGGHSPKKVKKLYHSNAVGPSSFEYLEQRRIDEKNDSSGRY